MNVIDFRATYAKPIPADGAIPFELTAQEREAAAFAQAHLRFRARTAPARNAARKSSERTERGFLALDEPV